MNNKNNLKCRIVVADQFLEKMNFAAHELEKEGVYIEKMDYISGEILGVAENPKRLESLECVKLSETLRVFKTNDEKLDRLLSKDSICPEKFIDLIFAK